ncbi:MAG: hypothetical protein PHN69_00155 [Candidatus Pacebacteria bacterium]|nr:hypothetical protein [Candidatus Paceibacterota bacterium]
MNIKRMADEYRDRVMSSVRSLKSMILDEKSEPPHLHYKGRLSIPRMCIKRCYRFLYRSFGSEKDIKELQKVWECLVKINQKGINRLSEKDSEKLNPQSQLIFDEAVAHLDKLLEKLPKLIEKSLTRAVRESGIRLR